MGLRETLEDIYNRRGTLTPAIVVEEASNPNHPLHKRFPWDDAEAARIGRERIAADLIRSVTITYSDTKGKPRDVRAFYTVDRGRDTEPWAYRPTADILADPIATAILLAELEREWKNLRAKYGHLADFAAIIQAGLDMEAA